jgi:hypothetical protein
LEWATRQISDTRVGYFLYQKFAQCFTQEYVVSLQEDFRMARKRHMLPSVNENRYAMTFGGDYGFKDSAESMILSASAESMMLRV